MKVYIVRNAKTLKYHAAPQGGNSRWTDKLEDARIYTTVGRARGVAKRLLRDWYELSHCELLDYELTYTGNAYPWPPEKKGAA